MQKKALIVFTRRPEQGKVKTRIAAETGDEKALVIYKKLLMYTQHITSSVSSDVFVFTTGNGSDDIWEGYTVMEQVEGHLGNRMKNAFMLLLKKGYTHVAIIGSDCLQLTSAFIEKCFQQLNSHEIVIGPAEDGGYYLLGMKQLHSPLFENKQWGTSTVYADTLQNINALNLSFFILPVLNDVDEVSDVPKDWL